MTTAYVVSQMGSFVDSDLALRRQNLPMNAAPGRQPVDAIVFDMDGILVSSLDVHWRAYQRTFLSVNREFTQDEYRRVAAGASREVVMRRVLGELPVDELNRLMEEKERHVTEILSVDGVPTVPGAREFLRQVRERRVPTAVATSSRSATIFLAAAVLDHAFDAIIDRTHVSLPKPAPDCYNAAAAALDLPPSRCLALEDTPVGIEAALASGMQVIALTTSSSPDELSEATAVYTGYPDIQLDDWLA